MDATHTLDLDPRNVTVAPPVNPPKPPSHASNERVQVNLTAASRLKLKICDAGRL